VLHVHSSGGGTTCLSPVSDELLLHMHLEALG